MSVMYATGDYEIHRSFTAVVTPSNSFVEESKIARATPFTRKRSIDHCPYVIDDYEDGSIFFPDLKKLYEPITETHYDQAADFREKPHGELASGLVENDSLRDQKHNYELLLKQCMASAVASSLHSESLSKKVSTLENENEILKGALKKANEQMEKAKIITANTAHDLKSPLQTLILGLEVIRSDAVAAERHHQILDYLESACAFMNSAICRSIDHTKYSNGVGLTPSKSSFDLKSSLNEPMKWIRAVIPAESKKEVVLDPLPAGIANIVSDRHWMQENLLCLLSNADKYSSEGVIRVSVRQVQCSIRISVQDSGTGIPAESKPLLFKQFSQLQNATTGSTGLGLFSLLQRSEAIGGSCGVEDRTDGAQGSVFWFEVPFEPAEAIAAAIDRSESVSSIAASSPTSLSILVVDDSACVVKCVSNKLACRGHRVVSACNGAVAMQKMIDMAGQLDLVLMDVQMPVMDGFEATRRYREIELLQGSRRLPIICSSSNSGGAVEALAIAAGMDSFLSKPFTVDELSAAIASI